MSTQAAVQLIEGPQGTAVTLTIARPKRLQPLTFRVVRGSFPDVIFRSVDNVGYIEFSIFGSDTAAAVHDALQQMLSRHMTSLILDVRDNGGGYVDTARALASDFLPRGAVIVWERANLGDVWRKGEYCTLSPGHRP